MGKVNHVVLLTLSINKRLTSCVNTVVEGTQFAFLFSPVVKVHISYTERDGKGSEGETKAKECLQKVHFSWSRL